MGSIARGSLHDVPLFNVEGDAKEDERLEIYDWYQEYEKW